MQSTGQASTPAVAFVPIRGSAAHAGLPAPIAEGGLFQLFFWNTGQTSCLPSAQFWPRVWRVAVPLWLPRIIPLPPEADYRTQGVAIGAFERDRVTSLL